MTGLSFGGCATTADHKPAQDIRGAAAVTGRDAQPLVAGPIRLLHANFESRVAPHFSRVWKRGDHIDCNSATPLAWDGQTEVELRKDELICVAAGATTPSSIIPLQLSSAPLQASCAETYVHAYSHFLSPSRSNSI